MPRYSLTEGPCRKTPAQRALATQLASGMPLVVQTSGFNDKTWLDQMGHRLTEGLRLVERFRRLEFGHMELQIRAMIPAPSRGRSSRLAGT